MKRGSTSSGRAAADRRVEPLGVTDRERDAAPRGRGNHARRPRRASRAIGFSTRTGTPASRNGSAMSRCSSSAPQSSPHRRWPQQIARVEQRRVSVRRGDLLGPGAIGVDDGDERRRPAATRGSARDACPRYPTPMTANAQRAFMRSSASARPTIAISASSAALTIASPSIISVLPASTDSTRRAGGLHRLDRRHADDRHVEAHVLLRLRDLDDPHAPAGQLTGARDHRIGPFHRFDRDDRRRLDGDRLADVEAGDRVGDAVAEREIGLLVARSALAASARLPAPAAASRNAVESRSVMPWSRSTSATAEMIASVFRALSRISTPSARQVGHDVGEQLGVLDLSGHHRLR